MTAPGMMSPDRAPQTPARRATTDALAEAGAVAVVRLADASAGEAVVDALLAGGVRAVEITFTMTGALDLIATLARRHGDALLLGAGSVLTPDVARHAIDAGARYVVSPVFDVQVLAMAHRHDVAALPGACTPTEILRAWQAGADVVKVFPSDTLGPAFIRNVLAPMPFLPLMPTGGVTPDNVGAWMDAGAVAVGLGSALVDPTLVQRGDLAALTTRAQTVVAQVAAARVRRSAR